MKKLIVIIGVNLGIGLVIVKLFVFNDYFMILIDKNINVFEIFELKNCLIKKIDVRDFEFLNNVVSEVEFKFGLVDLMFNNVGIMLLDKYYE